MAARMRSWASLILALGWALAGCSDWVAAAPTATPYPFVTATPRPSATPTVIAPTSTPTHTRRAPSPTPPPTRQPTGTITPTATLQPTATIAGVSGIPCAYAPLGVFGEVYQSDPGIPTAMGCPTAPIGSEEPPRIWPVQITYQPFERGHMVWLSNVGWYESKVVYVLLDDSTYARYDDTYDPSRDAERAGPVPPVGLFRPTEALGKIWFQTPGLVERIGFATALPTAVATEMQLFEYGEMIAVPPASAVFVFKRGNPSTWSGYSLPGS